MARETGATWQAVQIVADDGVTLRAWFFTPRASTHATVMVLHGIGDNREGAMSPARLLLHNGFAVLAPDSRGHGVSGGDLVTYGVKEAADVHRWSDWLFESQRTEELYGLGESLGGAVLLQSLRTETRFRAVIAECSFATFEDIAYDRLSQASGLPRVLLWPVVQTGFLYGFFRYGVDLRQASPAAAVRSTQIPILLIHGQDDVKTPPWHSRALHALNPNATELWEVPGTGHVEAIGTHQKEFGERVVGWFNRHPRRS